MNNTFTLRPATFSDLEAVVDFCNLWEEASTGTRSFSIENMRSSWESPGFDLAHSTCIAEDEQAEIVSWAMVSDVPDPPVAPYLQFAVHPHRDGKRLGDLILGWAEVRCQECLARVPEDLRVIIEAGTLSTHAARIQRLERAGYEQARVFIDMEIKLETHPPQPQWPAGIKVMNYNTLAEVLDNLEPIMSAVNESFRDHWGHVERPMDIVLERWSHRIRNDSEFDPALWFLAMDGDEIAATCLCRRRSYENPEEGYVDILGVRRRWRRRGLGLALLQHAFAEFYRRGKPLAGLGVDADSITGAVGLYERAGMHPARHFLAYAKELRAGRDLSVR